MSFSSPWDVAMMFEVAPLVRTMISLVLMMPPLLTIVFDASYCVVVVVVRWNRISSWCDDDGYEVTRVIFCRTQHSTRTHPRE